MKLSSAIIVFGLLASNAFVPADARSDDGSPFLRIVAHRGASADRPECTLSAIRRAIEVGAHVVEIDVRTSKDGVLFLLHDSTLDRTTDGTGPANERTMAELKELDAGGWFNEAHRSERIPTLGEALEACRGKIDVLLDLKETGETYAKAVTDDV
jgi:glycerophosphoryl diester phosphodiesterase